MTPALAPQRILMLGATGTIGRATVHALLAQGHHIVCIVRPRNPAPIPGTETRAADVTDPVSLATEGIRGETFDVLLSCLASRTGAPTDAWAIDHAAHMHALAAAQAAGVGHVVLLSAICVQKPRLAFQHAKLAFEQELIASGLRYSIVRPTAYFKSVSGQIERVRQGRPFVMFGNGRTTACKPISDTDLADYLTGCLHDPTRWNRILPIGGPGPPITPHDMGAALFGLLDRPPRYRHVPIKVLDAAIALLAALGRLWPACTEKAELARIGRYYATESMLVWNPATARYDAAATPEWGQDTLFAYYRQVAEGKASVERGAHAVF